MPNKVVHDQATVQVELKLNPVTQAVKSIMENGSGDSIKDWESKDWESEDTKS